jgi:hypothetical protein
MNALMRIVLACLLMLAWVPAGFAAPVFGSYRGLVENERLDSEQLLKLEFINSRLPDGNIKIRAILTAQFGGFESGEYVSYHFEDVMFNLVSGIITFNQGDMEVHLSDVKILGNEISGILHSSSGRVGPFRLSSTEPPKLKKPLVEPLGGEYTGKCGKVISSLQLMTYRSTVDTTRLGNPFGVYEVKGQIGKFDAYYCSDQPNDRCAYTKVDSVSYNYFVGDLVMSGYPFGLSCKVRGGKIDCGECTFKRISDEMRAPLLKEKPKSENLEVDVKSRLSVKSSASIGGDYQGYLFHEHLGLYQKIGLEVATFNRPGPEGSSLMVSAVANARFGSSDNEVIAYRFNAVEYPNPVLPPEFVLSRPEADVDVILSIRSIRGGVIEGTWYSMIFGRVGEFVVTKNGDLPMLSSSKVFGDVSSGYVEKGGVGTLLKIIVAKGNAPIGSDNPFDPLNFFGYVWRKSGTTVKEEILSGSYDFYTGKIAILFGKNKTLNGFMVPGRVPNLRRLGGGFGTILQPFRMLPFERTNNLP